MPISKTTKRFNLLSRTMMALVVVGLGACSNIPSGQQGANALDEEIAYLRLTDNYWQVWLTDRAGNGHRQVTFDTVDKTRMSWSPDGQRLLCNRNDGQLLMVPVAEGKPSLLRLPVKGMLDAQWSPEGERIIYSMQSTQQQDNNDVWVINNDGAGAKKLVNQPGASQLPSWHPNGEDFVYAQYRGREEHHVWRYHGKTRSREQLTVGDASYFDPALSTDGQLTYTSNRTGNYEIWLRDEQGNARPLTQHPAYDAQPSWSPSGKEVAFYSQREQGRRIWIKSLIENRLYPLTPKDASTRHPVWR